MDRRVHHMTDPWPNRLGREEACAEDRHPPPAKPGKLWEATQPSTEQVPTKPRAEKR